MIKYSIDVQNYYVKEILPNVEEVIAGEEYTKTQINILTEKV